MVPPKCPLCILIFLVISQYASAQIRVYAFTSYEWLRDKNKEEIISNPAKEESAQNLFLAVELMKASHRSMSFESGVGLTSKEVLFYEDEASVKQVNSMSPRGYIRYNSYIIGRFLSINGKVDFIYDKALQGVSEEYKPGIVRVSVGGSVMPVRRLKLYFNWVMTSFTKYRGHEAGIGYYFYQF